MNPSSDEGKSIKIEGGRTTEPMKKNKASATTHPQVTSVCWPKCQKLCIHNVERSNRHNGRIKLDDCKVFYDRIISCSELYVYISGIAMELVYNLHRRVIKRPGL